MPGLIITHVAEARQRGGDFFSKPRRRGAIFLKPHKIFCENASGVRDDTA